MCWKSTLPSAGGNYHVLHEDSSCSVHVCVRMCVSGDFLSVSFFNPVNHWPTSVIWRSPAPTQTRRVSMIISGWTALSSDWLRESGSAVIDLQNTEKFWLTLFLKECALIGSSAANEQLLRMMKTRMRLVKMWWWIRMWQPTRILQTETDGWIRLQGSGIYKFVSALFTQSGSVTL